MVKDITVYTTNNCPYCVMVKKYLTIKGKSFNEINVDEQPEMRNAMIGMTGQNRVPVTVVTTVDGSQKVTTGYNITQLAAAVNV